jgi:hypothetical protein
MQPAFLQSTGRTFLDIAMCANVALTTYHESMSSAVGFRARESAMPADVRASMTHDLGSGESSPESFASYDHATFSWKTLQLSFIEDLAVFSETWPRSGTMQSGTAYRLRPLVPRISGTGCTSWPTPTVHGMEGRNTKYAQGGTPLSAAVRMAERGMGPTPIAGDGEKMSSGSLARAVRPELPWRYDGRERPMFPTPRAKESGSWQRDRSKGKGRKKLTLTGAAKMYPTPTASDAVGGAAYSRPPSRQGSPTLKESTPGALNPQWVEWLMGFPLGWTDLED